MHRRGTILGIALLTLLTARGISCGPFFTEAVFVIHHAETKSSLVAGRVGILWTDTRYSELALTYRRLHGPAFTPAEVHAFGALDARHAAEQKAEAVQHAQYVKAPWEYTNYQPESKGRAAWGAASLLAQSKSIPAAGGPVSSDKPVPGQPYQSYPNCLDDAFATAARTLRERLRVHANDLADVADWVKGQDAVFSNCSAPGSFPANVPATKPAWLQQDRAYQQAAAHFYRAEWSPATAGFSAIAQDSNSPWHDLAAYLVGRTTLRQAGLGPDLGDGFSAIKFDGNVMRTAQAQFQAVAARHGRYATPALAMLRLIDYRLDPGGALARLGAAISHPDPILVQDTIDVGYVMCCYGSTPQVIAEGRKNDLIDWVLTVRRDGDMRIWVSNPEAHALARWHATHSTVWLAAALALANKPDPDMLAAAAAVDKDDPAWTSLTYHRLRLTQDQTAAHAELAEILPGIEQTESLSTINAFRELALKNALTTGEFMKIAALHPVAYDDEDGDFGIGEGGSRASIAGIRANAPDSEHVNLYAAQVLNEHLPIATLAELVQQNTFPKQLQFEFALAVWSRAVLLDKPGIAAALTPTLAAGEPRWKPFLDAYDNASTDDERKITGLLAMLRFPAIRPYLNAGASREEGFAAYSYYRDNWWCADMAAGAYSGDSNFNELWRTGEQKAASEPPLHPLPAFLTAEWSAQAQQEHTTLKNLGDAPGYFGREALAWVHAHPHDPRNAQLLDFTARAMRNGCNLEKYYSLHRTIDALRHKR